MRTLRLLSAAVLLACAATVAAQQPPLEQQMTHQEFVDAGLNKLTAEELAALNAWLQRRGVGPDTAAIERAREEGRREATERRGGGLFGGGSNEPVESTLAGEFRGFGKGNRYTLANGQVWEQTDGASLAGVRLADPKVTIRPGMLGVWWMRVGDYNTQAKVQRVR